MAKLLVVEDNPTYRAAAEQFFAGTAHEVTWAGDYESAMQVLQSGTPLEGIITDCFFPQRVGSGETALGLEVVKTMQAADPS